MRNPLILLGIACSLAGVGTVLAQSTVDDLDLEAVDRRAKQGAADMAAFVASVLHNQAAQTAAQADATQAAHAAQQNLASSSSQAKPGGDPIDLDGMVADAGQIAQPHQSRAPMLIAFASLLMPQDALTRMIVDVSKAGGVVVFRGFSAGGGHGFMTMLRKAVPEGTDAHISIDPRLFRAFAVDAVPTFVAASSSFELCSAPGCASAATPYDRLSGNVTTRFALETFADGNGPGAPLARKALRNLEGPQ